MVKDVDAISTSSERKHTLIFFKILFILQIQKYNQKIKNCVNFYQWSFYNDNIGLVVI